MYYILEFVLYIFTLAALCGYVGFMLTNFMALTFGWRWLHSYQPPSPSHAVDYPGVSIIKPLIGFDLNMKENLESFFQLNYPKYELIFCVAESENKPVQKILNELTAKYPSVDASIFQGGVKIGINPKINNMMPGYKSSKHELIWICDSNIKTSPNVLLEMTSHMSDSQVGLVHQLPYVENVKGFSGYVEKVYFGTQHSRVYLIGTMFEKNCANGMSWLVRKKALEEEGGIQAFTEYLAEDFFMGRALWQKGWKFVLSTVPAKQNPSVRSLSCYQMRIIRWGRLRATMMPWPGLLEPLTESICIGTISSFCVFNVFGIHPALFFLFHLVLWFSLDLMLIRVVENDPVGSLLCIFLAWCLREVWTIPLFLAGVWSREVIWKGQRYKLLFGGKAIKLD